MSFYVSICYQISRFMSSLVASNKRPFVRLSKASKLKKSSLTTMFFRIASFALHKNKAPFYFAYS